MIFLRILCYLFPVWAVLVARDGTFDEFPQQTGTFGPQPGDYDVNGTLVNYPAQKTLCNPPKEGTPFKDSIVLVFRGGDCSFFQKTMAAQIGGAVGIIIGNNADDTLIPMGSQPGDNISAIVIPAVFVGKSTYFELDSRIPTAPLAILNTAGEVGEDFWFQMLKTGGIGIAFILAFALLYGFFRYCKQRRALAVRAHAANRLPLLAFDVEEHEAGKGLSSAIINNACAICLEDFTGSTSVKVLPCRHGFHVPCIDEWLARSDLCPICKHSVLEIREDDPLFRDMLNQNRRCPCRCCCC
jgi:E3 ubiquitin-protein ligase RNF13